jgi:hypothetical protein
LIRGDRSGPGGRQPADAIAAACGVRGYTDIAGVVSLACWEGFETGAALLSGSAQYSLHTLTASRGRFLAPRWDCRATRRDHPPILPAPGDTDPAAPITLRQRHVSHAKPPSPGLIPNGLKITACAVVCAPVIGVPAARNARSGAVAAISAPTRCGVCLTCCQGNTRSCRLLCDGPRRWDDQRD